MATPRKFSEKIALHNQKQAEETAAFEAIMREVSGATRGAYQKNHLQISNQNLGAYRGGSLPNVNQIGQNSIDLRNALHNLEDLKGGQNPLDRIHRDRTRQLSGHRRPFSLDKRQQVDCSPYGSVYLSPPPDTSWRRTASDSALHQSAMTPDQVPAPTTPPANRRMVDMMVDGMITSDQQMKGYLDPKKLQQQMIQSRPKSCEVPGINIYPSTEQDTGVHIPISNNTGSLPDLTNLHFPSPLSTPLDADEQGSPYPQGSPVNLSPTSAHHMCPHPAQQQSPGARRRQAHTTPSPLVLPGSPGQMRHPTAQQGHILDPARLALEHSYQIYLREQLQRQEQQQQQQQHQQQNHQTSQQQNQPQHQIAQSQTNAHHHRQHPSSHPSQHSQLHTHLSQNNSQTSMQYRNNQTDTSCQSPTSPLSQTSYSPSQSPGLPPNTPSSSPFSDSYYIHQQHQQTNALQQQFEQFNMLQDSQPSTLSNGNGNMNSYVGQVNLAFSQANNLGGLGSPDLQQQQQQHRFYQQAMSQQMGQTGPGPGPGGPQSPQQQQAPHSPGAAPPLSPQHQPNNQHLAQQPPNTCNKIPDIILTGADESLGRQDFAKDIGSAMAGMSDTFDSELFPSDETLKIGLDPLDLDGLQMLTDPNMVTDPATEDSFRLDRL